MKITGLHHVTAIAGDPQQNLDFYVGLLGMRLVKRTVNFDDPGSYHFYFGDATGTPGSILTFFPIPGARRGIRGSGEISATAFSIPAAALGYWVERLKAHHVSAEQVGARFGEEVIRFADPDGMLLELVGVESLPDAEAWGDATVPVEHAIRGVHGVSAQLNSTEATAALLTDVFGYELAGKEGNRTRYTAAGEAALGRHVDLLATPGMAPGRQSAGTVHHIAFRTPDDASQLAWREQLTQLGHHVSPVRDRTYFHSIYFREPGGVLFEIATDPPGFTLDEAPEELGTQLRLPDWAESSRLRIEAALPAITLPQGALI